MFAAQQVMTRNLVTVREDMPIYEAMKILAEQNITGLPVVSADDRVVGIVSEKDMLKLLYGPHIKQGAVSEIMTRDVVCFDENDDLVDICECLIQKHFRRVPILSEGKLVGIISRRDIIKFILELRTKNKTGGDT